LLRSFRSRLALTVAGSAALAAGTGLAVPHVVRSRAEAAIAARTNARVTIGDAHVGWSRTIFDDVVITSDAMEIALGHVTATGSTFGLATRGTSAITAIAIEGGHVSADVNAIADRLRARSDESASSGASGSRTISIAHVAITLRVDGETAMSIDGANARWDGATLAATVDGVALGNETIDHAELDAGRSDGTWQVMRLALGRVVVSADTVSGEGPFTRIVHAIRGPSSASASSAPHEGRIAMLERHLAQTFGASVEDLTVRRTIDGTPHDVIASLRASISRAATHRYTTEGEGRPEGGGSLGWRLDLEPDALTASGTVTLDRVALAAFVPLLPESIPFSEPERAHVSGHLELSTNDAQAVHAEGTLALEDFALAHPRIAPEPVRGIAFSLRGAADLSPSDHRIAISSLSLAMGAAQASLAGTIEWADDHYLIDGHATLPRTRCDEAVHAIPRDLLGDTSAFHLVGDIGASITTRIDSRDLPATTLSIQVANGCTFTSWPVSADTARFAGSFEHHVEEPDGTTFTMTTGPGTDAWTPIAEISPFLVHAVLAHEDAGFFEHSGFAPWAIREALIRDLTAGRYVAGGSTITMQLVKNVFLHREKTLARKIQEVLLTWWIETRMDKEHLLELYLNVIEYGPGVYGIRHAAEHYFGRSPADLSPAESAYLALILPNPPRFHEQYERGEIPRAFRNRIASFVRVCGTRGRYDADAVAYGVAEAETLSFHREGDPPPPERTTEGAVAAIPEIQFFSTVPLARLSVDDTPGDEPVDDPAWDDDSTWEQ
jgi:hypothetical protein